MNIHFISPSDPAGSFPNVEDALEEPNGLLAIGGDLTPARLLNAYVRGIFPWFSEGQPILWWSPNPRLVLYPAQFHTSRSLRKTLAHDAFEVKFDTAFADVMRACAKPRKKQAGTWITDEMVLAYRQLHKLGYAHSIESWQDGVLVGGLYGIAIGKVFFGESMFAAVTDASKVAFAHLVERLKALDFRLIDCQVATEHLVSFGAREIPRAEFVTQVREWCLIDSIRGKWTGNPAAEADASRP